MFTGTYQQTIDSKGRVSIPVKFREVLNDPRLMITQFTMDGTDCLDVHPMTGWTELAERLSKQDDTFDPSVIRLVTFYVGAACPCELDQQGRILVPPTLRDEVGLQRDIFLVGALSKFRIFSSEGWQAAKTNARAKVNDPDELKRVSEIIGRR